MGRKAGSYNTRLLWMLYTKNRDDQTGQVRDSFTDNGELWASVEDKAAVKLETIGSMTAQNTTEIRINNYPTVGTKDQLREKGTDAYYTIDGISRGDGELILSCTRKQVR